MNASLEVKGLSGLAANFRGFIPDLNAQIRARSERAGQDAVKVARQLVPKDTRRTMRAISYRLSEQGLVVTVFVDPQPFADDGVPFYPPYVEFGTSTSPEQPFLFPAWEAIRPFYEQDIREALLEVAKQRSIR